MKSKILIPIIIISALMITSTCLAWNGDTWGSISRQEIASIANNMIDSLWTPRYTIYNWTYDSRTTFYFGTVYRGMAYCLKTTPDNWDEFFLAVNTTSGGYTAYGNDCSGFASISWRLSARYVTRCFEQDATSNGSFYCNVHGVYHDDHCHSLGQVGSGGEVTLLQGDALNASGNHIILFDRYTASGIVSMEQTPGPRTSSNEMRRFWSWTSLNNYRPIRRNLISGDTPLPPTVETNSATDVTGAAATLNATITDDGGASVDERRFDWGTTPSCSDGWTADVTVNGNAFSYRLTGLQPDTTYYFRGWAHNSVGWSHGDVFSFATTVPSYPDLIVEDIWIEPGEFCPGDEVKLYQRTKNIGDGDAVGTFRIQRYFDGSAVSHADKNGLVAGGSYTSYYTYTWPLDCNPHTIKVVVDVDGAITESNENNNERSGTFWASDTTPPTPDPMTWWTEPYQTSTSSISMVATTASDPSTPISYYFDFYSSPTGGTGGTDSGWQSVTSYTDYSLQANHQYGYRVKAKDNVGNETAYSSISYEYTDIETPSGITFGNITNTSIQAKSSNTPSGLTRGNSGLRIYNTTNGTDSGWKQNNDYWISGGLSVNTQYGFRVKARNGDSDETGYCSTYYRYTLANSLVAATFSNISQMSIQANWAANGNPSGTEYFCENTTNGTNFGWTTNTYWNDIGLTSETGYCYRVKARNGDDVETEWTDLGCQTTWAWEIAPMDLNNDGIVSFGDFVIFASYWMDDICSDPDWCEGSDSDYSGRVDFVDLLNFVDYWLWCRADLNLDGAVNFTDYAIFAYNWMDQNCAEPNWCNGADLNKSGSVDLYDLGKFAEHWLEGVE